MENTEELDYEEQDVMSLLATESEEADEHDEEADEPGTLEEALALLNKEREIKSKRNKSLKKAKQAVHRTQEESDALRSRLDQLESRLNSQPSGETDKLEQQIQEWQERVADDPSQAVAYTNWMQKNMEDKVANYVGSEIHTIKQMISEMRGEYNPERQEYKAEIAKLRQNEDFEDLPEDMLLKLAKGLKKAKIRTPRGGIGGGRASADKPKKFEMNDEMRIKFGFEPRGE